MRTLDLDQIRPMVGQFTLNGKVFKVMKPTIGQRLTHRKEHEQAWKDIKTLEGKPEEVPSIDYLEKVNAWKAREVQIFIPEFELEDLKNLDDTRLNKILEIIFEIKEEDSSEEKAEKKSVGE